MVAFCRFRYPLTLSRHVKGRAVPINLLNEIGLRSKHLPRTLPLQSICFQGARDDAPQNCNSVWETVDQNVELMVVAAHRDLGSENIFSSADALVPCHFALIDWEFFTDTAPALTDQVGIWFEPIPRFEGWRNKKIRRSTAFLSHFSDSPDGKIGAVIALFHLAELGIDLANILIESKAHDKDSM